MHETLQKYNIDSTSVRRSNFLQRLFMASLRGNDFFSSDVCKLGRLDDRERIIEKGKVFFSCVCIFILSVHLLEFWVQMTKKSPKKVPWKKIPKKQFPEENPHEKRSPEKWSVVKNSPKKRYLFKE